MMNPAVSVVISTYNRKNKLERALRSVSNQTFKDIEIMVVDNASTDGTAEMLLSIQDPRVRVIWHDTNKGGPAARNAGIRQARASLIALLDDDDAWMSEKLARQVEKIRQAPGVVGLVYVGSEIYDELAHRVLRVNRPCYRGQVYQRLLLSTILSSVSSVLVKRECFARAGLFDEELTSCQDWDMWLRIARHFEFDFVDETLVRINMHAEQISTDYNKLIPGRTRMVQKHAGEFKQYPGIYVVHLKRVGKLHCLNGTWRQGLSWFRQAVQVRPLEAFKITAWLIFEWPWVKLSAYARKFKQYKV